MKGTLKECFSHLTCINFQKMEIIKPEIWKERKEKNGRLKSN